MAHRKYRLRPAQPGLCASGHCRRIAFARILRHRTIRFISAPAFLVPRHAGESRASLHAGMLSDCDFTCWGSVWEESRGFQILNKVCEKTNPRPCKNCEPVEDSA